MQCRADETTGESANKERESLSTEREKQGKYENTRFDLLIEMV